MHIVYTDTPTHAAQAVTTVTTAALAAQAARSYALFVNDSDAVMWLMVGASAVANQGIRLNANGGSYEMARGYGNLVQEAIYAIHSGSGSKTLLVSERT